MDAYDVVIPDRFQAEDASLHLPRGGVRAGEWEMPRYVILQNGGFGDIDVLIDLREFHRTDIVIHHGFGFCPDYGYLWFCH